MKTEYAIFAVLGLTVGLVGFTPPHTKYTHQVRIAILDSGLDVNDPRFSEHICAYEDFTYTGIEDNLGHGTHVAGTIASYLGNKDYCFIILKYVNIRGLSLYSYKQALASLEKYHPDVVNFSGGGETYEEDEYAIIKKLKHTAFIVAAGNYANNIREVPFYPASYKLDNVIPVGAMDKNGHRHIFSNWGKGVEWEVGVDIDSTLPFSVNSDGHGKMTGSSMATAVHTGKFINVNF